MSGQSNWINELLNRRIPQILGMYVATVWLCVEIADWMSERFSVSQSFSAYVFVALISMIPAIAFIAWGHGKPGKDQWTRSQLLIVIFNLILAIYATWHWVEQPRASSQGMEPAIKTITVEDERSGHLIDYEVAKEGMSQKVAIFAWQNNSGNKDHDWLQHGAGWLLGKDLSRTPLISVQTLLTSGAMRQLLGDKGLDQGMGESLPLALQVAQKRSVQWLVRGEISQQGEELTFKAELYDVISGALIKTISYRHVNWLLALDEISKQISDVILSEHSQIEQNFPDLSLSDHLSSNTQAIQFLIDALHSLAFDNDYEKAKQALLTSTSLDPNMAEAYVQQMKLHVNSGEYQQAAEMAEKALNLDYKLYGEEVFEVKAQLYGITGQEDKALKVIENWTKVYPESVRAWLSLANNLLVKGNRLDDAVIAIRKLIDIEPGSQHFLRLSNIHILNDDLKSAESALKELLDLQPNHTGALMALGDLSLRQGQFDRAKQYFEDAELYGSGEFAARLQLAQVEIHVGDIGQAESQLLGLLDDSKNEQQQMQVYLMLEKLYLQRGQFTKALELLETSYSVSQSTQVPIAHLLTYNGKKIGYLAALGQREAARVAMSKLKAQTKSPFREMLVLMKLSYDSLIADYEQLKSDLEQAKAVLENFNMSIYQQFIMHYEAVLKRFENDYDVALSIHEKAINESKQSILTLSNREVLIGFYYEQAKTQFRASLYAEAVATLDYILQSHPRHPESKLLKAEVLLQQGKKQAVKMLFEQLDRQWIDADPEYMEYQRFQKLKAEL